MANKIKVARVPKFVLEPEGKPPISVEFYAVNDCPGFSHRVVINGAAKDWHGNHTPVNGPSAIFFAKKHGLLE